jgi:hypothetical protein
VLHTETWTRLRDESAQVQTQYDMTLQQKKELEGRMEEIMKTKEGAEERETKNPKRRRMMQKLWYRRRRPLSNKLYKQVPEVPLVIEATMEEQLLKIGEVMKRFREQIQDLQLQSMPDTCHLRCTRVD